MLEGARPYGFRLCAIALDGCLIELASGSLSSTKFSVGYVLVAVVAGTDAKEAVALYLAAYTVTTLGAFAVVTVLSGPQGDAGSLEDYRGLFWRRPVLAGVFTALLYRSRAFPRLSDFSASST